MEIDERGAEEILKKYAPNEEALQRVLEHSRRVRDKAVSLAEKIKEVDLNFIKTAALLHDIGRFIYPPGRRNGILHGVEGAKILRKEGLPKHARVAETHIGVGITREDIIKQGLPLPLKDYVPTTKEEIIIAYADNLDSPGVKSEKDVEERFAREVGEEYRKRVQEFHELVHRIVGDIS